MAFSETEFLAFYKSKLLPLLEKLEPGHKRMRNDFLKFVIPAFVVSVLIGYVLPVSVVLKLCIALTSTYLLGVVLFAVKFRKELTYFRTIFKGEIIAPIIGFVDATFSYSSKEYISKREFDESKIFNVGNEFKGDDLVTGKTGNVEFKFCEVNYYDRDNFKDMSKHRDRSRSVFKGLFLQASLPQSVHGETMVFPAGKKSEVKRFNLNGYYHKSAKLQIVPTEDAEFSKRFVVYSNNPKEAKDILTSAFSNNLLTISKQLDRTMFLSFKADKVYVAISSYGSGLSLKRNATFFEPPFFKSLLKYKLYRAHVTVINNVISLTHLFDKR